MTTELESWLGERAAHYLQTPDAAINPEIPFADLGLDSVCLLCLAGDIEERLGIIIDPMLAWDHPTIRSLAAHLAQSLTR